MGRKRSLLNKGGAMLVWYWLQEVFGGFREGSQQSRLFVWGISCTAGLAVICVLVFMPWGGRSLYGLNGTVSVAGEPVEQGEILFDPEPGQGLQSRSAPVVDGLFSVKKDKGLTFGGRYIIRVLGFRPTGEKYENEDQDMSAEILEQVIPIQYNSESKILLTMDSEAIGEYFELALP